MKRLGGFSLWFVTDWMLVREKYDWRLMWIVVRIPRDHWMRIGQVEQ